MQSSLSISVSPHTSLTVQRSNRNALEPLAFAPPSKPLNLRFCGLTREALGLSSLRRNSDSFRFRLSSSARVRRADKFFVSASLSDNGSPPKTFDYDLLIVGAGVGGHGAALHAVEKGLKTAIIEGDVVGGTCVNRGCVPSKALLAVSGRMRELQNDHHLKALGLQVSAAGYDRQGVADHANNLASKIRNNLTNSMKALGVDILTGFGTILGPQKVKVGSDKVVTAKDIIIATGSIPFIPKGIEVDGKTVITSDHALKLESVPDWIAIVGSGYIGLEFSDVYTALGSEVTFIEALDQLMPGFDPEIGKLAQRVLINPRKIDYHTGVFATKITPAKDGKPVTIELIDAKTKEPKDTLEVDAALIATGRAPFTHGLGLENINVATQRGFVPVDERMRVIDSNGNLAQPSVSLSLSLIHLQCQSQKPCTHARAAPQQHSSIPPSSRTRQEMVFKGRFFSSSKKSDSSSADGSNSSSPRSLSTNSNSPSRSDKKKPKAASTTSSKDNPSSTRTQFKDGTQKKDSKGKETVTPSQTPSKPGSNLGSGSGSRTKKEVTPAEAPSSVSPILASSLGLNRIKTRSGPLPQESFFGFRSSDKGSALGASNLSRHGKVDTGSDSGSGSGTGGKKEAVGPSRMLGFQEHWVDNGSKSDSMSTGSAQSKDQSPNVIARSCLQNGESSSQPGRYGSSWRHSGGLRSSDVCTPETTYDCDNPKESESPRFQAILRLTSAPRKRPADIKSFSHELNSKGVRPFPFWKSRGLNNLEEILVVIRAKFDKAKEEVNSDLAVFAADLIGILEKNSDSHPEWQETIEDLLVLARSCAMTSPGEFWLQCEGIVQELDDRRQEHLPGMLKQLHTRMLFILTRCTRLLQFHKESLAEDEHVFPLRQPTIPNFAEKRIPPGMGRESKSSSSAKASNAASARKSYSQEQHSLDWKRDHVIQPGNFLSPPANDSLKSLEPPLVRDKIASWKKLPSPPGKNMKDTVLLKEQHEGKVETLRKVNSRRATSDTDLAVAKPPELPPAKDSHEHSSKHQHRISWGYGGDQQHISDETSIICRICEEEVPTLNVEGHSRICAIADRCDQKGQRVNERLVRISETLEKMTELFAQKDVQHVVGSPDVAKVSNSSVTEESDILSPKLSDWSRRGSEDMLDCFPEADNSVLMDDLKGLPSMTCKTRFGPKSDQGMTTSSAGSMTPRSPLLTPRSSQIDLLLAGKGAYSEHDDVPQMNELADIARCVANTPLDDDRSMPYLLSCLEDLRIVIERRKFDALTVETFGTRIEKLIREKYLQLCEMVDDEKIDMNSTIIDEDAPLEDDVVRSLRTSPIHSSKDRTSIDDFEIIKPISRGAFGRVFLAKKRTTGDLFAIKVLKKADMIRKNAVESILAERDILISVRNPFVVRFFYSFTCRENLYLVMEYLNGGDLYSLLRNLGCLDEDVARVYIAEVVLALEYLHSLRVVHRDLKPDNLLIAHDGHIKLTDFGLSKVGLINSTDDLSGPAVSGTSLLVEDEPKLSVSEHQRERRKKRSAVGTPDYLAPEILLGTGHGATADWWSVGVILFELVVGIPPFNAEHPQTIFDNILNRNIPWPRVPEEMSPEAQDLIDRLLTEDPDQRLGARGASEVKQHVFFKNINWDTLARQKAAFVPSSESALDTSYFTSRYSWNPSDYTAYPASEEDSSDNDSISGSSSCLSHRQDEVGDECGGLTEFESGSSVNYSFSNFSFKNLSQLASINYDLLSKGFKDEHPTNPNA